MIKIAKGGITFGRRFVQWSQVSMVEEINGRVDITLASGKIVECGPSTEKHWSSDLFDAIVKAMGGEV